MKKHYCEKCGKELIYEVKEVKKGYDPNTGERIIKTEYYWRCPNFYLNDSHTHIVSFESDFNSRHRIRIDHSCEWML